MKLLRLFLVVLLVVMVPLRGVLAAAMPCQGDTAPAHGLADTSATMHHGDMHERADGAMHDHHSHGASGHADRCNLCDACCGGTALPSTLQLNVEAAAPSLARFAELTVPPPGDVQGGQERPPRSI